MKVSVLLVGHTADFILGGTQRFKSHTHTHTHARTHARTHTRARAHTHAQPHISVRAPERQYKRMHMHARPLPPPHIQSRTHECTRKHTHAHTNAYAHKTHRLWTNHQHSLESLEGGMQLPEWEVTLHVTIQENGCTRNLSSYSVG